MTIEEIKHNSVQMLTDYLNRTIDEACGIVSAEEDPYFPLTVMNNTSRFSDTLRDHAQDMVDIFLHSKNKTGAGYSLEMESVNTRSNGRRSIIRRVYFENENDYLDYVSVHPKVAVLKMAVTSLKREEVLDGKSLSAWAKKNVRELTKNRPEPTAFWRNIAACAKWLSQSRNGEPQGNLSVPPDFIEANKALIQSLLTPPEVSSSRENPSLENESPSENPAVKEKKAAKTESVEKQEREYPAFVAPPIEPSSRPLSVRFRSLSASSPLKLGRLVPEEIGLPLNDFIHLNQSSFLRDITTVMIVSNETVYQNFPHSEHTLCIYGPGYTVNALKLCEWFSRYKIIYCGDISEHCFDVLSTFRTAYPKTESLCMDGDTWETFLSRAEQGDSLKNEAVPPNLTEEEKHTFLSLRLVRGKNRLCLEAVPSDYLLGRLEAMKPADETEGK